MNRPRLAAVIVLVLLVLLAAPIVLLALAGPVAAPASSTPVPSASPIGFSASQIPFVEAASPEEAAWYRIGADPRLFPPHLQVGTMGEGETFDLALQVNPNMAPNATVPLRVVAGVGAGIVVMVDDDGHRSSVRAIVASTGEVHELLASDDVVLDAVFDAPGREVFYVTADRLTGELTGAWRFSIDDRGGPLPIESLAAAPPTIRLVAIAEFATRLMLSPDGTTLALWRCVQLDCLLRTVRTVDGSLVGEIVLDRGGDDPFGITDRLAAVRPVCPDGPECIGGVLDLGTGARMAIHRGAWQFFSEAVVEGEAGPVLAIQIAGWSAPPEAMGQAAGAPPEVAIIGLGDLELNARYTPPLSSLRIVQSDDYVFGADLPPGWILLQGSEPGELVMAAYALKLSDGSLVPLPAMGEFVVQG